MAQIIPLPVNLAAQLFYLERDRKVLKLASTGLSLAAIATQMHCSVEAVRISLARALRVPLPGRRQPRRRRITKGG
jgi:DNA-binding NarL/FixJ family response regulator